jgi:two-component system, OmpR family, sensor kinase
LAVDNARLYRDSQQAIRTRDEFLSVAAHELKTPVTSLRGFSQLTMRYLDRNADEAALDMGRVRHALESIDQQADKLARLIQQLLGITRIQSGRLVLERESMDLMTLVKNVADSGQARTTRHTITVDGPPNLLINADQLRLEQVLTNLVDNAIKYSPDGGPISIHLMAEPDDFAIISVSDRGLGIEPEHRDKIFDLFYQAHGQSKLGGMGLGLYISREIVELHGGSMGAEFPAEGGTCFVVRLPIAMQNVPTPEASGHEA